jgi:predicted ferric reductase
MTLWQTITWETARASGFVAYLLFTGAVAVGLALTQQWQNAHWPRVINNEMHNFLALVGLVFVGIHILAVLLDPFTAFGLNEILIPFVSHYRPLWMGLGITAFYLGLAILLSTWLRTYIGYTWWRRLHVLTLVGYLLVTLHGLATGTDTRTWWGFLIYGGSVALIGCLVWVRLMEPATARARKHPVIAAIVGGVIAVVALWALLGPLQANWGTLAGNIVAPTPTP